ncbi:MAG TPA: carboxymuconolactone decarboxylase family protein [Candidatus Cybelea sp.]|jgi:AhpD family alkylhydroperoxidase
MTTHTIELKARIKHPVAIFPEAMRALQALGKVAHNSAVPLPTLLLVELRASQINGCSVCVDMHSRELKRHGATDERIFGVAAWRDNPAFDQAERAALALTEALTRISDGSEPVSDDVWDEAARHYDEAGLATLVIAIANINVWNRLNAAVRQVVGDWKV